VRDGLNPRGGSRAGGGRFRGGGGGRRMGMMGLEGAAGGRAFCCSGGFVRRNGTRGLRAVAARW